LKKLIRIFRLTTMLSLVSLALFGTAHAQNCGVALTQAGGMMFSNTPPSYACTDWIRVRFTYTGSIEVFGRNGCGVVLYNELTGSQRTVWSNGGSQGRGQKEYYRSPGQRYRYYYLLCPGDGGVAHAMQSRPRGRRLEQEVPTLQRRLNNNYWGESLGGEYGEDEFEADALVDDYDYGNALDDYDYGNINNGLYQDAGEDMWADAGEDMWAEMGEDLFSDDDDDGEDMWDGQEDLWDGQEDLVSDDDDQLGTGLDAMNLNFGNGVQYGDDLSTLGDNPLGTGLGAMNTDFGDDLW